MRYELVTFGERVAISRHDAAEPAQAGDIIEAGEAVWHVDQVDQTLAVPRLLCSPAGRGELVAQEIVRRLSLRR